jgi:hypothetical protein
MYKTTNASAGDLRAAYDNFLRRKIKLAENYGFEISQSQINELLFPHQKDITQHVIQGGRRAVFASFGLGKTFMQLEIAQQIINRTGKPFFIGLPLGVKQEFVKDAAKLGYKCKYVKDQSEVSENIIYLSNYERIRDGKFIPEAFGGVSFDEASVIRSMGTLTTQYILSHFKKIPFRFVFTATPSPNEYHELLKYADFLGIMDISQALNRYFKRDSVKAHNSSLLEHREQDFWAWVNSWATFITKPSDLGYEDKGYALPELKVIYHEVKVAERTFTKDKNGNDIMFRVASASLKDAAKEKRESLPERVEKMLEITSAAADDHFLIWHHLEDERKAIETALPEAKSVYGSQDYELRESRLIGFGEGEFKYLATKPEIAGSGCNFQYYCHKAIFLGIDYKFNDFIQAVHRIYRFLQNQPVEIHIIYTDQEYNILKTLQAKWKRHNYMVNQMTEILRENGLTGIKYSLDKKRTFMQDRKESKGQNYHCINNDSIIECAEMEENSTDLIVSSIPFSDLFEYAESYNDMGQSNGDTEFFQHMDFLTPNLLRILKPGRIAAIHVKDCIKYSYQNGAGCTTINRFSDKTADHFEKHGFLSVGRITIPTDVVKENAQTYRLGWSEQCKDGTKMGVGLPEYILLFRKMPTDASNAYADEPVTKSKNEYSRARWQLDAHAIWKTNRNRLLTPEEIKKLSLSDIMKWWKDYDLSTEYNFEEHVNLCESLDKSGKLSSSFMAVPPKSANEFIMDDVTRMRTLNTSQAVSKRIKHVCPLQFDIVDRVIERFSNKGETVFDPFGGIMTVPYRSILLERIGKAVELNELYWRDGVRYCRDAEAKKAAPTLFDVLKTA